MTTELWMNGQAVLFSHTAWADDPEGTGFSLTEYEGALYTGNYIDSVSTDSEDPSRYEWSVAETVDDAPEPDSTYDELLSDVLSDMEEVAGDIEIAGANIEGTQSTSDAGLGNVNELIGTNKGTDGWSKSGSIVLTAHSDSVYADTDDKVDILTVTCSSKGSNYITFRAEELRAKLAEDTPDNAYTFSCDIRMSELFDIPVIAVQNKDGTSVQLTFDAFESVAEEELDEVDLSGTWIHHTSTATVIGDGDEPVPASSQEVFFDLSLMPKDAVLEIANLKIEGGGLATPWRESLKEIREKADKALSVAEEAKHDAELAHTAAQNAERDAVSAAESARSAESSAASAESSARAAVGSAGTAASAAAEAQRSAGEAARSASNAEESAGSASSSAANAERDARSASENASKAVSDAKTANEAANGAVKSLGQVQKVVETLDKDVDDLQTHIAMMDDGLHVVPTGNGYYIVLGSDAMRVYDNLGVLVATYGESINFSASRPQRIGNDTSFIEYYDSDGDGIPDSIRIVAASITMSSGKTVDKAISDIESKASNAEENASKSAASAKSAQEAAEDLKARADNGEFDGRDGEDAVLLRIDSSRGNVFKNNMVATVLTVNILKAGETITGAQRMKAVFGQSAYIQWYWRRIDDDQFYTILPTDSMITDEGFTLTLTPDKVDTKVTFQCELVV